MKNLVNSTVLVLSAVAIFVSVVAYNKTPDRVVGSTGPQGPKGEQGIPGPTGKDGVTTVKHVYEPVPKLGAVSTLDGITSQYVSINGVKQEFIGMPIQAATSTLCQVQAPNAHTGILYTRINVSSSSLTSTATIRLATSTSMNATTTSWQTFSLTPSASRAFTVMASSSIGSTLTNLAPNTWITWNIEGVAAPSTSQIAGTCDFVRITH